jgi:hypothetical protein
MNQTATATQARDMLPESNHPGKQESGPVSSTGTTALAGRKRKGRRVYEYQNGSWWSHLLYGLGTLVFLVVPSMMPGATVTGLVKLYIGFLVICYGIICAWGVLRAMRTPVAGISRRH